MPMFKKRDEVVAYLKHYHARHHLQPWTRFGHRLRQVTKTHGGHWQLCVDTPTGVQVFKCRSVALCVSKLRAPYEPAIEGRERFRGPVLHTASYRNGARFRGQKVLVIGSGNSACEVALDLHSHGAEEVTILVSGGRQVVPMARFRDTMRRARWQGTVPCLEERAYADWSLHHSEAAFADACARRSALMASMSEDTSDLGISSPSVGFAEAQVAEVGT